MQLLLHNVLTHCFCTSSIRIIFLITKGIIVPSMYVDETECNIPSAAENKNKYLNLYSAITREELVSFRYNNCLMEK